MAFAGGLPAAVTTPSRQCIDSVSLQCSRPPLLCHSPFLDFAPAALRKICGTFSTRNCFKLGVSPCASHRQSPPALAASPDFAPAALTKSLGTSLARDVPTLGVSRSRRCGKLFSEKAEVRWGLHVRAQARVGRADGQAESESGVTGADEKRRRRDRIGDQDSTRKAKALEDSTIYPIMRVYRNDLSSLEIAGDAQAWQAVEAMAADGGLTASEELSKGRPLMTVETIIPGRSGDHSTVSTKLLSPTHLVHRAAKTIWIDNKISMSSGNALAKAFQKVVMKHLLSFDIHIHSPGTVRDMANLANETEDAVMARLESRDRNVLEGLAQAVTSYSMANIRDKFRHGSSGQSRHETIFAFLRKPQWIWVLNKAIGIRSLSESEIREQTKRMLDGKNALGQRNRSYQSWWPTPPVSLPSEPLPDQVPENWITEFIPIHKVQIDTSKLKVNAKGWQTTRTQQVLELYLTHSQLVDLADMLDLYFEDKYTTPAKVLRSTVELKVSHFSQSKVANTLWTLILSGVVGGILLVGLLVGAKLKASSSTNLPSVNHSVASSSSISDSSFTCKWCRIRPDRQALPPKNEDLPAQEMESLCLQVVNRLKDAFNLPGEVESSPGRGAWIGAELSQWGRSQNTVENRVDNADGNGREEVTRDTENQPYVVKDSDTNREPETMADNPLLLYQVVLTRNGHIIGFQPGNKAAIGFWANFPFAKELHRRRRLGAGLFESGLKYSPLSKDVVAIELLCEESSSPAFTARPLQ